MTTCAYCGKEFQLTRKDRQYCSKNCNSRAADSRREPIECNHCHKLRPMRARGMCNSCYRQWFRNNRQTPYNCTCKVCGTTFTSREKTTTVCSRKCASTLALQSEGRQEWLKQIAANKKPPKPRLTPEQIEASHRAQMSALRIAYEDRDSHAFFNELKQRSILDERGCWNWTYIKGGYPRIRFGKESLGLHRVSCEMKYGKPLGTQHAHHICGNSHCVNPAHIEPATAAQNVGEMLARTSYEARISELEQELARLDPTNELLNRISYGNHE